MDDYGCHNVELYIYDMTQGMARMMSPLLLGRQVDGIWHTAVVVFGREYFYGSHGISAVPPGSVSILGSPTKVEKIGETFIPYQVFKDYLRGLADSSFRGSCYSLLKHNCNTFSEDLCQFLCGASIPKYILDLPQEFLSTPLGQSLGPLIESLGQRTDGYSNFSFESQITTPVRSPSPDYIEINTQIEQLREQSSALEERRQQSLDKIAKKERKREKKRNKERKQSNKVTFSDSSEYNSTGMSEIEEANGTTESPVINSEMLPSEKVLEEEAEERRLEEEKKKNREPPIVFKEIDPKYELEELVKLVDGNLSEEEQLALEELHQYLLLGDGCWALSDLFLVFVGRVLRDPQISTEARVHLLRSLAYAALKDDIILLLHQDRRDHVMMNYLLDIEKIKPEEQQAVALFANNLFENTNASEWLLYISEWPSGSQQVSNIRATTKVVVHCLLSPCPKLQELGTALTYNLGIKEVKTVVFDDIAIEITMAILQFLNSNPSEEYLFRVLKALSKFVYVSADIPQFVQMIGPNPKDFRGKSDRCDQLIDIIVKKVR
ncbi:unnamed protein product [Chironomus riparius]|uniref:PPPDE domain-containing protein n=1 Tax=Chironomus riparius TaxID=315576 RepID=A0A9N9RS21_9DIPT|nr:unnamed protein product [Chironomus riparius]